MTDDPMPFVPSPDRTVAEVQSMMDAERVGTPMEDLPWRMAERVAVPLPNPRPALRAELDAIGMWAWVTVDLEHDRVIAYGPSARSAWFTAVATAKATGVPIDEPWIFPWPTTHP